MGSQGGIAGWDQLLDNSGEGPITFPAHPSSESEDQQLAVPAVMFKLKWTPEDGGSEAR